MIGDGMCMFQIISDNDFNVKTMDINICSDKI